MTVTRWIQWWRLLGGDWVKESRPPGYVLPSRHLPSGYAVRILDWKSARLGDPRGAEVDYLETGPVSPLRWRLSRAIRRSMKHQDEIDTIERRKALG